MRLEKLFTISLLVGSIVLTGCSDKDSANSKNYEQSMNLDQGRYEPVIRDLGDCMADEKDTAEQNSCFNRLSDGDKLNLGASYFGKAGYSLVAIGKDLAAIGEDEEGSDKVTNIIMSRLDSKYMEKGVESYKATLANRDSSICTEVKYPSLNQNQKQACISINPILLKELLDDEKADSAKSDSLVSLEYIIDFKNVLQDASPELGIEEIIDIVTDESNSTVTATNVNGNSHYDSVEASDCVIKGYNTETAGILDSTICASDDVNMAELTSNAFSENSELNNTKLVEVTVASSDPATISDNKFYRLVQEESGGVFTTLKTEKKIYCDSSANVKSSCSAVDVANNCIPCPVIRNGSVVTLNSTVKTVLNNDTLLTSMALAKDSENEGASDEEKLANFKTELCGSSDCSVDQNSLLNYMK